MENFHLHQAATSRSVSPLSPPPPPSPPLSPDSAAANARWTPTREQIEVLEGLYSEGLRTPSSEQIYQLTVRLRELGPIEGKNIFYWFQNHKARQRQKEKQQTFEYFARQFHRPQPLPMLHRAPGHPYPRAGTAPPPPQQQVMRQVWPPQHPAAGNTDQVMYMQQQQQQVYMAKTGKAVQAAYYSQMQQQQPWAERAPSGAMVYHHYPARTSDAGTQQEPIQLHSPPNAGGYMYRAAEARPGQPPRTLNLFPLHPTFAQREKRPRGRPRTAKPSASSASTSASGASAVRGFSLEPGSSGSGSRNGEASVPFFDFFSLGSGGL